MKRCYPLHLPPLSHRQIAPPATSMTPLLYLVSLPITHNLHHFCARTLIEPEFQVAATNSLISSIYEALDAPLFDESEVSFFDSEFSENLANDSTGLEYGIDDSMVHETFFGEPVDLGDEGFLELCGGDLVQQRAEAAAVMMEEEDAPTGSPPLSDLDEMIWILILAYLKPPNPRDRPPRGVKLDDDFFPSHLSRRNYSTLVFSMAVNSLLRIE
ncbi:hypothetical protein OROHE_013263 [Orobanche hederae]